MSLDLFGHRDEHFGREVRYAVSNLAREQVRLGHRPTVHLLTRARRPHERSFEGVRVRFHPFVGPPAGWPLERQFARQLSLGMLHSIGASDVDLVHFHSARSLHAMLVATALCAARAHIPLIVHDHGARDVGPVVDFAHRRALRRAAAAVAGNDAAAAAFVSAGVPPARVHVVPNGVDLEVFRRGPRAIERSGDGRPFRVLAVSRLSPEKDPLTLAAAVADLAKRAPPVSVRVVGDGPLRAAVAEELERSAATVELIAQVPQARLAQLYHEADVVALTSLHEGANQVVLEAMASGIPVVATDIPGIRSVTADAALLVPPANPAAVSAALARLASDREERRRFRERGLERAASLSWDAVARRIDRVYDDALAAP